MATTSPDNIRYPALADPYAIVQDMGLLADSVQAALERRANTYKGTSAQRTAFTTATEGTLWQDTNGAKYLWVRRSGSWRGVLPLAGDIVFTPTAANTTSSVDLTFPSGYFASKPAINLSVQTASPQAIDFSFGGPSPTGFSIYGRRTSVDAFNVAWTATPIL